MFKLSRYGVISIKYWCLFCDKPINPYQIYPIKGFDYTWECHKCFNKDVGTK